MAGAARLLTPDPWTLTPEPWTLNPCPTQVLHSWRARHNFNLILFLDYSMYPNQELQRYEELQRYDTGTTII